MWVLLLVFCHVVLCNPPVVPLPDDPISTLVLDAGAMINTFVTNITEQDVSC